MGNEASCIFIPDPLQGYRGKSLYLPMLDLGLVGVRGAALLYG